MQVAQIPQNPSTRETEHIRENGIQFYNVASRACLRIQERVCHASLQGDK